MGDRYDVREPTEAMKQLGLHFYVHDNFNDLAICWSVSRDHADLICKALNQ